MDTTQNIILGANSCVASSLQPRRIHCAVSVATFRVPCASSQYLTFLEVSK